MSVADQIAKMGGFIVEAADRVWLVQLDDAAVEVVVRDDGHGLVADRKPGVGLRSMQERAAEVGGTLSVTSAAEGTAIAARLPLSLRGAVDHADPR